MRFKLLHLYLFRRFLNNLLFCTAAILVIYIVVDYVGKIKKFSGVPLSTMALYYLVSMPSIINLVFSIIMLLTAMFTIGNLSRHNEITAMRSAGLSIFSITRPVIYFTFFLVLLNIIFNETILHRINQLREDMYQTVIKKRPKDYDVRDGNFYYVGRNDILFHFKGLYDARPKVGEDVGIDFFDKTILQHKLSCRRLVWVKDHWQAEDGLIRSFSKDGFTSRRFARLSDFPRRLMDRPEDILKKEVTTDEMNFRELSDFIDNMKRTGQDPANINARRADLQFKFSLPFISFIIVMFGVSLTVKTGRAGMSRVFGIGLFCGFFYYFLVHLGLGFGRSGTVNPVLGAWLGNMVFFPLSAAYFYKVSKLE